MLLPILALALGGACTAEKEKSSDILSHAEMVKALMDVYLIEQRVNHLGLASDSATTIVYRLKSEVFKKTKVSDSAFNKSFNYYIDRPTELEAIYAAVVDSLTLKEQLLNVSPP